MTPPRIIIDAALFCPHCGARHVDGGDDKWHRRAHTTHRCQACGKDFDVYVSGSSAAPTDASTDDADFRAFVASRPEAAPTPPPTNHDARGNGTFNHGGGCFGVVVDGACMRCCARQVQPAPALVLSRGLATNLRDVYAAAMGDSRRKFGDLTSTVRQAWTEVARHAIIELAKADSESRAVETTAKKIATWLEKLGEQSASFGDSFRALANEIRGRDWK
jgi:hypothetical protein